MDWTKKARVLVVLLVAAGVLLGVSDTVLAAKQRTIGIISLYLAAAVPPRIGNEAVKLCKQEGWKPILVDTKSDQQRLISTCLTWVQERVDAIFVLFPSVGLLEGEVIPACRKAGIPVVTISGWTKGVTFDIAPNEYVASALETTYMVDRLGHEGNIVAMEWLTDPCPRKRIQVMKAILAENPGIKMLAEHVTKMPGHIDDCRKAMESLLLANREPGKIKAVWGAWDELALGPMQAIEAPGRKDIFVVGIDGNLWTFDEIRKPGSPFAATVAIQWEKAAHIFVEQMKAHFAGGRITKSQFYIPCYLVTKENCPPKGHYYNPEGVYQ
ncbi:MAG: substrate-binding domain-containing protein [Deltaproteobacteria bacterium]|nr:substrate-binding domain-containing protein [Deltaproteobacteria bacterium]